MIDFPDNNNNNFSFKFIQPGHTGNDGLENVVLMVPLKYLNHFLRTLEMLIVN